MAKDRSLLEVNHKLLKQSQILQETIQALLAQRRPVSVLEIGCGSGRMLKPGGIALVRVTARAGIILTAGRRTISCSRLTTCACSCGTAMS